MAEKYRKVSVLLCEEEFLQLDRMCELHGYKKSTLIVRLLREFIAANPAPSGEVPAKQNAQARRSK